MNREITGSAEVVLERIKKEIKFNRGVRQTVVREILPALELTCGHKIILRHFRKVPKKSTWCHICAGDTDRDVKINFKVIK